MEVVSIGVNLTFKVIFTPLEYVPTMAKMGAFLVGIHILKKYSPLPGFEPTTYQVTVYEAADTPICHRASVYGKFSI